MTKRIFLHLGSNIGDRAQYLSDANLLISNNIGSIVQYSKLYKTAAWGVENQADFLNQAIEIQTSLSPTELLTTIHEIELKLKRVRHQKWHPRTIDIDILFYENLILETPELTIPHALIAKRNFVLIPMLDIAADFVHPVLQVPMDVLYWDSKDGQDVVEWLS